MFSNMMQVGMNGAGSGSNTNSIFAQNFQTNQGSLDANNFIKILSAILLGFNNAAIDAGSGLFANRDGQAIDFNELANGLFADTKVEVIADADITDILQQMMSSALGGQILPAVQPVSNGIQESQNLADGIGKLNMHMANGNAVMTSMLRSEDGMQKIKIHANTNPDAGFQLQMKTKTSAVIGQEPQNQNMIPETETLQSPVKPSELKTSVKLSELKSNLADALQPLQSKLSEAASSLARNNNAVNHLQEQIKEAMNGENVESVINISDAQAMPDIDEKSGNIPVSAAHSYQTSYAKNDPAVKESLHVSRLNELGEPIIKTLGTGDKHLVIKLEPPDLGSIQIKLRMTNGVLTADIRVDSNAVRDLFSAAIPQIRASLEDSGIKVSDFFVDVKEEDYYSDGGRQQDDTNQQQHKQNKESKFQFFDYFA